MRFLFCLIMSIMWFVISKGAEGSYSHAALVISHVWLVGGCIMAGQGKK